MKSTFKATVLGSTLAVLAFAGHAQAAVIDVTFTTSGSAGDWVYDFTFTNNLPNTNDIYFVGVELPATDVVASPAGWDSNNNTPWSNAGLGGSATLYNNVWCTENCAFVGPAVITPGGSLGGFQAHDASMVALTSVRWFAFATGGTYDGVECFNCGTNPGFEGVSGVVPEPASWALMIGGFALTGAALRRRRAVAV